MAYKTKDLKVDTLLKDYFTDPCHFADMINATIFDGRQVVQPENVSDFDTSTSTFHDDDYYPITVDRDRDVIKKVTIGDFSILIGIENHSQEKWNVPYCVMEYNALTQIRQWHQIHSASDRRKNPPIKSISLVLYYAEKRWKGPRTYDEVMKQVPKEFEELSRYNMFPTTDVISLDYHKNRNQNNMDLMKGLQMLYQWEGNLSVFEGMVMSRIVTLILAALANDRELLHIINKNKEEKIDMCESIRLYRERILNEGENKGLIETLVDLLKLKLGKLSPKVEKEIENINDEQLNKLKLKIFTIENEEDILNSIK